jgi:hypothetical protein
LAIREEGTLENYLIVSLEDTRRRYGGIEVVSPGPPIQFHRKPETPHPL